VNSNWSHGCGARGIKKRDGAWGSFRRLGNLLSAGMDEAMKNGSHLPQLNGRNELPTEEELGQSKRRWRGHSSRQKRVGGRERQAEGSYYGKPLKEKMGDGGSLPWPEINHGRLLKDLIAYRGEGGGAEGMREGDIRKKTTQSSDNIE